MKKNTVSIALAIILSSLMFTSPVQAEETIEQTAEQEQQIEFECETETNGYGQTTTKCYGKGEQGQVLGQKVVLVDGEPVKEHQMVDTALDTKSLFAAISAVMTGAGAFVLKLKTKV